MGIDIEYMDENFIYADIIQPFFKVETTKISSMKDFYTYWVAKESYVKYKGIGLFQDLGSIEVIELSNHTGIIKDHDTHKSFTIFKIYNSYVVAVCF